MTTTGIPRNATSYHALAQSAATAELLGAFVNGTGWQVRLHAPTEPPGPAACRQNACGVCAVLRQNSAGRAACQRFRRELLARVRQTRQPQRRRCHARLTELAVPVLAHQEHLATLIAYRACHRPPAMNQIDALTRRIGWHPRGKPARQLGRAYRGIPVIGTGAQQAHLRLLQLIAHQLGDTARRLLFAAHDHEPVCVHKAKEYVGKNLATKLTRCVVAKHVGLCPYRFGQLYQQSTGLTLSQYVRAHRVERAKELLRDPGRKLVDLAFEAGFQSHATFYRAFRQLTGQSAAEYRQSFSSGL